MLVVHFPTLLHVPEHLTVHWIYIMIASSCARLHELNMRSMVKALQRVAFLA
jgi:hypothetical protein